MLRTSLWARVARAGWAACTSAGLLAGCGGVGTGGTGAFASGPITGFGSVIVDGVEFEDSAARIEADDGSTRARTELGLGTVVEIESDEIQDGRAQASRVRIVSAAIGRVDAVSAQALVVSGQTVYVNAGTVFDDRFAGGLAGVAVGRTVEVHGLLVGASGDLVATRVEPNDTASALKVRAIIGALDTQARTFRIGAQTYAYPPQLSGSAELRNGALLRVVTETAPDAQGRWPVLAVASALPRVDDVAQARWRGIVTAYTSDANFQVDGLAVNASAARIDGGPLAAGQRVELEGRLQDGVLLARRVEVEEQDGDDLLQVNGVVTSVDTTARVFVLNGRRERVSYARSDLVFENGDAAALAPGRKVLVFGMLSADGTLVEATRVRFDP